MQKTYFSWEALNSETGEILTSSKTDYLGEAGAFKSASFELRKLAREGDLLPGSYKVTVVKSESGTKGPSKLYYIEGYREPPQTYQESLQPVKLLGLPGGPMWDPLEKGYI